MNLKEDLKELVCSKSNRQIHFVEKPISLPCGHCVCKGCLSEEPYQTIQCFHCGMINNRDLRCDNESLATRKLIKLYLRNLYSEIENETREELSILKSNKSNIILTD